MLRQGLICSPPTTADEFAAYFRKSELGLHNSAEVEVFRAQRATDMNLARTYEASVRAERSTRSKGGAYTLSIIAQVRAVMVRRVQIIKGNVAEVIIFTA
jgi:ATP-binding cassette subfamily G (WHITE) protein 2 (SNQ2)